jgi:hypothetical protein
MRPLEPFPAARRTAPIQGPPADTKYLRARDAVKQAASLEKTRSFPAQQRKINGEPASLAPPFTPPSSLRVTLREWAQIRSLR